MRLLFQMEATGDWTDAARDLFLGEPSLFPEETDGAADLPYFFAAFDAARAHLSEIDAMLGERSDKWTVRRMANVERAILRLACAEILWIDQIDPKVSVNEAVELAKAYGSDKSPAYVNGVLAGVLRLSGAAADSPGRDAS